MKKFPTLYKKTSTGAIQQWEISVYAEAGSVGAIYTEHGQVGGKIQKPAADIIKVGKNIGKANETTAYDQAVAEAQAKWEKQKKKGYVESAAGAEAGEIDALIEGGINPMLAHPFTKQGHKIIYPAMAQPKLDGIRCIAILKDGKCTLWSRTRKLITGVPHIAREIEKRFKGDLVLDGELYNHAYKKDFEQIVSFVRQEEPKEGHEVVQYHIYDMVNDNAFLSRWYDLVELMTKAKGKVGKEETLYLVVTVEAENTDEMQEYFSQYLADGYEGLMLRNKMGLYARKRSVDLQKVKEFDDAEFDIVGIEEGRGKLAGHAIFKCKTEDGTEFLAKLKGETSRLKEYFDDHKLWKGKKLTVQFQGYTGKEKVPRFPVGVAVRDYE